MKYLLIVLAIAAVVGIFIFATQHPAAPGVPVGNGGATTTASVGASPSAPASSHGTSASTGGATPAVAGLRVVRPAAGEIWLIGTPHTLQWSAPSGYGGGILLLDAATKAQVGWIASNLLRTQAQYSWDTQNITVNRTDPSRKSVSPGTYVFEVVFDGSRTTLLSPAFTLASSGSERILTKGVSINNLNFSPNFLTLNRGEQVVITNGDTAPATLLMNGVTLAKLSQGSSYVFDTNGRTSGSYELRIKEQVLAKLTLSIQ